MEQTIKPCPFCNVRPDAHPDYDRQYIPMCPQCGIYADVNYWNTRPIEDALAANDLIAALQTELAAVPKWTRITDDPATWPPANGPVLIYTPHLSGTYAGPYWVYWSGQAFLNDDDEPDGSSWLPITPPPEFADD